MAKRSLATGTKGKWNGFVVIGLTHKETGRPKQKRVRLSPHFHSKDACQTSLDLLQEQNRKDGKYADVFMTEE